MTELLIVGHLPVRASLWLVPYADLLARDVGTTCLLRLDGQEPTLQLLRAPQMMADAPLRTPMQQAMLDAGGCVDLWIMRGPEGMAAEHAVATQTDRITILTSADEAAVVSAYQTVKALAQAAEHTGRSLPRVGLAIVGADAPAAEGVIDRLNRTAISFLGVEMKLVALLPRMDAGIKCTRYATFGNEAMPSVLDVRQWIEQAKAMPRQPEQAAPSVIGRVAPAPETFVHDAARILRGESTERASPTAPQPVPSPAVSRWTTPTPANAPPAPPMSVPPTPAFAASVSQAERDDLIGAIGPASGAKLPPKVVIELEHKPPAAQRAIVEPDDHGQPLPLARFVAGLIALPLRPPGHERIEIAVDDAGRMHLLARETCLRELPVASQWARAHRELIAMACPQQRFDPAATPVCHVFTSEPALLADLHGCDLHLHVLAPVSVGEKTAWYAAPLNVVK